VAGVEVRHAGEDVDEVVHLEVVVGGRNIRVEHDLIHESNVVEVVGFGLGSIS
jgi:hypothetical protein